MPVSGVTVAILCPSCGAEFPVDVADESRELPPLGNASLQMTVTYRCPACGHLGEIELDVRSD